MKFRLTSSSILIAVEGLLRKTASRGVQGGAELLLGHRERPGHERPRNIGARRTRLPGEFCENSISEKEEFKVKQFFKRETAQVSRSWVKFWREMYSNWIFCSVSRFGQKLLCKFSRMEGNTMAAMQPGRKKTARGTSTKTVYQTSRLSY